MNHHEHHEGNHPELEECCGGGCCAEDTNADRAYKIWYILQWIFLWGAFLCSLLTLLLLPKIVRKEVTSEQALKAGWIENYLKLNKEIYETAEYKEITKQNIDMLIEQQKARMQMYKQQLQESANGAQTQEDLPLEETATTWEVVMQNTTTGN